ncbi:hypothetical protein C4K35_1886 [Pseudomonas chlororaphis subsp. piscium]|uniref:site-specific integrase n=1 Tax=Pseudomonas chlororaphis TaxID=587753 RepID=UPI000F55EF32|nr:site-specific integrase [Pseudomonas chlororaphis]AZC49479.1 hypothetical protein C4K35_1886 [Pseudomonas chlororaphis subsp. piscium]
MGTMATPWKHPTSGYYYIRRAIPKDLQAILGGLYKKTLGTKDPLTAKHLFAAAWLESEEKFALARSQRDGGTVLTSRDVQQLAARWFTKELSRLESSGDFKAFLYPLDGESHWGSLRDHFEDLGKVSGIIRPYIASALEVNHLPPVPTSSPLYGELVEAFSGHLFKLSDIALARLDGNWTVQPDVMPPAPLKVELQGKRHLLSQVFEEFRKDKLATEGETRTALKTAGEYHAVVLKFIELFGDPPVDQIGRQMIQDYRMALQQMPSKGDGIRGLNARQQIERAKEEGLPTLQAATIKTRLRTLSAVLGFGIRLGYIRENPVSASGIATRLAKSIAKSGGSRRRKDFTWDELKTIFTSQLYTSEGWSPPRKDLGKALYWIPLLAFYTGARREELTQLFARDVKKSPEGIPYLSILEADDDDERTVKTVGSRRAVPLHPDLIALGFLDYAKGLPKGGQLFPYLEPNDEGWYGKGYGKHWTKYLRGVVKLDSPASPSHGFRHTFKTLCRGVGIPEDVHDALTGHSDGSVSRDYGHMPLERLAQEIPKFPSIAREAGLL